ncbi:MAG: tripartite tricarboxylate transporter TctB family protein [Deltaproteobacteria bacterium]|nr:tripartite tricarboxylate transporter TctB family protein [Deltaproteobacteria bacterium]
MLKYDLIAGLVWLGLGSAIAMGSYQLQIGSFYKPGPGLFPFLIGLVLVACSIPVIILAILHAKKIRPEIAGFWSKSSRKLGWVLICLFAYALLVEKIGYLLTTSFILFFLLKTMGSLKLRILFPVLFLTVAISYYVFGVLLEVPLPPGIWRIR